MELKITFKPYNFEGTEYTELDLSGLEKLTIRDAIDVQKKLNNQQEVASMLISETTTAFCREIAAKATGLPIEFFKVAPRGVNRKIANTVKSFVNGAEEETVNHVLTVEKPVTWNGQIVPSVDLSGIDDLTSMNESEAENQLTREGFLISEPTFNYLYACILASMATTYPLEFYTGLPMVELTKLKNAVNDPSFFDQE